MTACFRATLAAAALLVPLSLSRGDDARPDLLAAAYDREIGALQKELETLSGEQVNTSQEIETLATREALSRRQYDKARWRRDTAAREASRLQRLSTDLDRATTAARARARSALRETYKQGASTDYVSLLSIDAPADVMRGLQSLDVLSRRQSEAVTEYARRRQEATDTAARLHEEQAALNLAVSEAEAQGRSLTEDRDARLRLLERIQKDKTLQTGAIEELKRAMSILNQSIASLPDGSSPVASISFSRLEGGLPWPVHGAIAVPFGSVRNPRFGTVTPHPGVEFRVEAGAVVRSVGVGRVVFNRRYGSYGRTVVIDHGERYLSVYARLAAASVVEGEDVIPGQQIGFAGESDAMDKAFVYFEIRHQGRAIDPAEWLRRSHAESGGKP